MTFGNARPQSQAVSSLEQTPPLWIAIVANWAQGEGLSGGDRIAIQSSRLWHQSGDAMIRVHTSEDGWDMWRRMKADPIPHQIWSARARQGVPVLLRLVARTVRSAWQSVIGGLGGADIVVSASDFLPDVLPGFIRKTMNRRVCWIQKIYHLVPSSRTGPHWAQRISVYFIRRLADLVIVDNSILKKELEGMGFRSERIEVNYPGIDVGYFRTINGAGKKSYDGVFLGRLHPSKGIFDLIEIWSLVVARAPHARLAIVGGGDEGVRKELEARIGAAGLSSCVDLLGTLGDEEAFGTIKAGQVFLFPSREEGFGMAILEAMACGVPTVAWDLPVYREVFTAGLVRIPPLRCNAFAETVIGLLQDADRRAAVRLEAMEIVPRYDWRQVVAREMSLIRKAVAAARSDLLPSLEGGAE